MTYILRFNEVDKDHISQVGGKGANLGEMVGAGLPVPPGFCVTARAYQDFLSEAGLQEPIRQIVAEMQNDSLQDVMSRSEAVQKLIVQSPIPIEIERSISQAYHDLCEEMGQQDLPVAVRSSATAEDLPDASFAGQQETYLNVRGVPSLLEHSRMCWASLWSHPAVTYRNEQGFEHEKVHLCIAVQAMIESDVAGILFTANPISGSRDEALMNASWGLGEAVVSGLVTPDTITVSRPERQILDYAMGTKEIAIHYAADGGIIEVKTSDEQRSGQALTDDQVLKLADLGGTIEAHYGAPQDIEWALRKDKLYVLQSRAITTLSDERAEVDEYDRSMFVEIFPDVLSPVFTSVVAPMFKSMLDYLIRYWGFKPIEDRPAIGVFYNLLYWNRDYVRNAFGGLSPEVREDLTSAITNPFGRHGAKTKRELSLPFLRLLANTLRFMIRFPKQMPGMLERYHDLLRSVDEISLEDTSDQGLVDAVRRLSFEGASPLLDSDFLMIVSLGRSYDMLGVLLEPSFGEETEEMQAKLVSGVTGNVVMESNKRIWDLAQAAKRSPDVIRVLREYDASQAEIALRNMPEAQEFMDQLDEFLAEYGHREIRTDILYPTWGEDPAPVLSFIEGYLDADEAQSPHVQQERLIGEREELLDRALGAIESSPKGRYLISPLFKWMLSQSQLHTRERDTMHFELTRIFPPARRILFELGERLSEQGLIDAPDDIFFLTLEEMDEVVQQRKSAKDKSRIAREEYEENRTKPWPYIIRGNEEIYAEIEVSEGDLQGLAGSPGVITGPARIIRGPDEFSTLEKGEILVAPLTNPTWTPLFAIAGGVITEVGSILSHGAIVAREYGIPAVMSIPGATQAIQDGQIITVDGNRGVVLVEGN